MNAYPSRRTKAGIAIISVGWILTFAAVTFFRPLMPMDETRYLSVAWEMREAGNWILPILNGQPYSEKPPLLFWLIGGAWNIFGVSVTSARIVTLFIAFAFLYLTGRLARVLFGKEDNLPITAALIMTAMPAYVVFGSAIMFDSLLALFVLTSVMFIWRAGQTDDHKNWIGLGLAIGLGILTKGPVMLAHVLPVALLAPYWNTERQICRRRWYSGVLCSVIIGAAIGLAWAIPAASEGGPLYAQKILLTQSAGRMVNAFAHKKPFWFYLPVLALFLLPLLAWPSFWSALRKGLTPNKPTRFLLCWILPSFTFFSLISGKSIHYLLPLMPGIAILAASVLTRQTLEKPRSIAVSVLLFVLPSVILLCARVLGISLNGFMIGNAGIALCIAHVILSGMIVALALRDTRYTVPALSISAFLLVVMMLTQLGQGYFKRYDFSEVAAQIHKYKDRPLAVTPKYDGEYGFLSRADVLFMPVPREYLGEWFVNHPDGVVIGRFEPHAMPDTAYYKILFQQPFRTSETLFIFEKTPGVIIPEGRAQKTPAGK